MSSIKRLRAIQPWRGTNPFTQEFRDLFNEIGEDVYRLNQLEPDIARVVSEREQPNDPGEAGTQVEQWPGRIISFVEIGGGPIGHRWQYIVRRQQSVIDNSHPELIDWLDEEGETFTVSAYNRAEMNNDGLDLEGYGIPVGMTPEMDAVITIEPILIGAFVDIRGEPTTDLTMDPPTIVTRWWFSAMNIPQVLCVEP